MVLAYLNLSYCPFIEETLQLGSGCFSSQRKVFSANTKMEVKMCENNFKFGATFKTFLQ